MKQAGATFPVDYPGGIGIHLMTWMMMNQKPALLSLCIVLWDFPETLSARGLSPSAFICFLMLEQNTGGRRIITKNSFISAYSLRCHL